MGSGIAQVVAQAGLAVHLTDVDEGALRKGLESVRKNLARSVKKDRISQDEMDETLGRIETGTEYAADADLAIEAVGETIEAKTEGFRWVDGLLGGEAILAPKTPFFSLTPLGSRSE